MAYDKVVDSAVLDAGMTATADAIRAKTGETDPIVWEAETGFKSAVEGIQAGGGGQWTTEGILSGTEPNGDIVFTGTSIVTAPGQITSFTSNTITLLPSSIFNGKTSIKRVSVPNVTDTKGYAFYGCTALEYADLSGYGANASRAMTFYNCTSLRFVDFGNCSQLENNCFYNCSDLKVVLRRTTMVSLANTAVFNKANNITIYTYASLIETYKTATNWSSLYTAGTCNFVAIEGSEYE